jgi:hypothetical protein
VNILPEQKELNKAVDTPLGSPTSSSSVRVGGSAPARNMEPPKSAASELSAIPESTVTLEKDSDGRFYYRVTDSQNGAVILEFPPEAVRNVGQGIEEYVRQHTRPTKRLEAKA